MGWSRFPQILGPFFHSSGCKPIYDKPQKTGRLLSRKYEFGTPVETRNLPKFENQYFRVLLTLGIFGVSFFLLLGILVDNMSSDTDLFHCFLCVNDFQRLSFEFNFVFGGRVAYFVNPRKHFLTMPRAVDDAGGCRPWSPAFFFFFSCP